MIESHWKSFVLALVLIATGFVAAPASAGTCTDGVDCYCDRVTNPSDPLYDPDALFCEDFDSPSLWDVDNHESYVGDGPPGYGPPYDGVWRGENSYWARKMGGSGVMGTCAWRGNTMPQNPQFGDVCPAGATCGPQTKINGQDPYDVGPEYCMNMMTDGGASVTGRTIYGGNSPSGNVFEGNASVEAVQQDGWEGGGLGSRGLPRRTTELGVTVALYFTGNTDASNILGQAIKGDEYGSSANPGYSEFYWGFQSNSPRSKYPYTGFFFTHSCVGARAREIVHVGQTGCAADLALVFNAAQWTRPNDYYDRWVCMRTHTKGLGTDNVEFKMWDQDGNLAVHISNIDGSQLRNQFYDEFLIDTYHNNYANTTQEVGRGYDNMHIRAGPPVSCEQIGFSGGPPPPPPPPPGPGPDPDPDPDPGPGPSPGPSPAAPAAPILLPPQ